MPWWNALGFVCTSIWKDQFCFCKKRILLYLVCNTNLTTPLSSDWLKFLQHKNLQTNNHSLSICAPEKEVLLWKQMKGRLLTVAYLLKRWVMNATPWVVFSTLVVTKLMEQITIHGPTWTILQCHAPLVHFGMKYMFVCHKTFVWKKIFRQTVITWMTMSQNGNCGSDYHCPKSIFHVFELSYGFNFANNYIIFEYS